MHISIAGRSDMCTISAYIYNTNTKLISQYYRKYWSLDHGLETSSIPNGIMYYKTYTLVLG